MQLQGRELGMMTTGDDVKLLQQELRQLGYSIPDTEASQGFFGQNTQAAVMDFQRKHSLQSTGRVDQPTATLINRDTDVLSLRFSVNGLVRHPDGRPVSGMFVAAFDKDLRDEQRLGNVATTNVEGRYEIKYTAAEFSRAEKKSADLIVRVYKDQQLPQPPLAESPIIFNAQPVETLDLVFGNQPFRGPAEFDQLLADIAPVLAAYQLQPAQLNDSDVKFLGSDTGHPFERLNFLVTAHRLQDETKLPAEVFYGFFRKNLPTDLISLLARGKEVLRLALEEAIKENIISTSLADQLPQSASLSLTERVLAELKRLIVAQAFKQPDANTPSLSSLLSLSIPHDKHAEFLNAYVNRKGTVEEFWQALSAHPDFSDKVSDIQFTLQLFTLTNGHLPLIQQLKAMQRRGEVASLKELSKFDVEDWKTLVRRPEVNLPADVPGKDADEKATNYAKAMTRLIEQSFPTAFVADRIAQDSTLSEPLRKDFERFFQNNPQFDLTATRFDTYAAQNSGALQGIEDEGKLKVELKGVQRLYKVAPSYANVRALMRGGVDSAFGITRMGRTAFGLSYSAEMGGHCEARVVYERAERSVATAINLLSEFGMGNSRISLHVATDRPVENIEGTADWATLFGSLDLCECEHCRSVYGPAAYFVDVLHFLRNRRLIDTFTRAADGNVTGVTWKSTTAKDALFERRADLGEIELTCENTNTPLPYVDLVNEVLENAIASFTPFSLAAERENDLNIHTLSDDLRNAFSPHLSKNATIKVKTASAWWTIDDTACIYNVRKMEGQPRVVSRSWQTHGTAEERAASPQYINTHAYDILRGQVYPWHLPFDLWMEEARAYLKHLGVALHEVMETFPPPDRAELPADLAIAYEHLGLTKNEADLITGRITGQSGSGTPGRWNLWGFTDATLRATTEATAEATAPANQIPDPADSTQWISGGLWLGVIAGRVDVFLQQSGLSHKEMLELLGTIYLNKPDEVTSVRPIQIQSTDPHEQDTCVTSKLRLDGFNEDLAVKISRFVRLQRKLGWTAHDLDKAITSLRPVDTVADWKEFLRGLSHVKRLQSALNLPLDGVLAFYSTIGATDYIDYQAPNQPVVSSLYARLFRNRNVINPLDSAFTENPLDHALTGTLTEHIPTITAAFGISAADFDLLLHDAHVIRQIPKPHPLPSHSDATIPDDSLSLHYLSRLYRHATLAKSLRLKTSDYLSALSLMSDDPFASTMATILFVERMGKVRESGFSIGALDYLLRHKFNSLTDAAPRDEEIALTLDELRGELQKIAAENTFREDPHDPTHATSDPDGEMTRKKLALLNWDSEVVNQIIALLKGATVFEAPLRSLPAGVTLPNDTGSYEASLAALPPGFVFPEGLAGFVSFDVDRHVLRASRHLTAPERRALLAADTETNYRTAVNELITAQDQLAGAVSYDPDEQVLRFVGAMTISRHDRLRDAASHLDTDYRNAVEALFNAPRDFVAANFQTFPMPDFSIMSVPVPFLTNANRDALFDRAVAPEGLDWTPERRLNFILKKLMNYLRPVLSASAIKQKLSEALKLEPKIADELLSKRLHLPAPTDPLIAPTDPLIAVFGADSFVQSDRREQLDRTVFPNQFNAFTLLHKTALIISTFKVTSKQFDWLFAHRNEPDAAWLDFNSLPLRPGDAPASFAGFERLMDLFRLRDQLPNGESLLTDIFDRARASDATIDNLLAELNKQTQWSLADLQFLAGAERLNLDQFKDEKRLGRLRACCAMLKRLGMSAQQCVDLANLSAIDDATEEDAAEKNRIARSVRQAVRAKYDEAEWVEIAKPLQDVLRETQRQALVAYLVTHPVRVSGTDGHARPAWRDVNGIYAHYLIDVEMSPCQMTSRIKQAISSVQLFVQRCLMNLERDVSVSAEFDDAWRQWKWMKNYRVWEANRKVFLYPENWIEPELRDDKSPFFKELENELVQNDLTFDTAETAFVHYLEKLDAVANLEIVGMYHQAEATCGHPAVDVMHVFGRTRGTPHIYYYRRRVDSAYWTAWEKVDLDIEGDHLIPVVWNRRLYLFWPIFTEENEETDGSVTLGEGKTISPPAKRWKIQLAWSERKQGKWAARKISTSSAKLLQRQLHMSVIRPSLRFKSHIDYESNVLSIALIARSFIVEVPNSPFRFQFEGCDSDPIIDDNAISIDVIPPAGTVPLYMEFVEFDDHSLLLPTPSESNALVTTPGTFRLLPPHEGSSLDAHPFFYSDNTRTFFVTPERVPESFVVWASDLAEPVGNRFHRDTYYSLVDPVIPDPLDPIGRPGDPALFERSFPRGSIITPADSSGTEGGTVTDRALMRTPVAETGVATASDAGSFTTTGLVSSLIPVARVETHYRFQTFYHPYVCRFVQELNRDGIDGLLQRQVQLTPRDSASNFFDAYAPTSIIEKGFDKEFYPQEDVDFSYSGAYAQYNWELFFHAPLLIADRLSKNQRFEEAQKWFHYIFDPTDTSSHEAPERYWRTRPFFETAPDEYLAQSIPDLLRFMADRTDARAFARLSPHARQFLAELPHLVSKWRENPFKPHLIARMRTTAYQKAVVMKYIDNLIAWGDQLFRRDTLESINEATQLYILAADMLGRRPKEIPPRAIAEMQTFNTIEPNLDSFSNALVGIEEFIAPSGATTVSLDTGGATMTLPTMLYFCVPKNEKLLSYWDTVADRLFKIRHCMNIEGVERQLPLFEPPIDPALLVRAVAAGVDIGSALTDISAALPHYRFNVMAQKASELCAEVKVLGGELLSVLEKRDAEALSLLRSTHEINLLNAVRQMKEKQIEEAKQNVEGLKKARDLALIREDFYRSRDFVNFWEAMHLESMAVSLVLKAIEATTHTTSGVLHLIPNFKIGSPFSVGATYGGDNTAESAKSFGVSMGTFASLLSEGASIAATVGGYSRRMDDWKLQEQLAAKEIQQIDRQIVAAQIRLAVAEQELRNHDLQIENAQAADQFMRDKFTNRELYHWMVGQISAVYFQSYQLAYDVAKRAERAYRFELGLPDSSFIQFGYWDSLKKGLLAGERLYHDIKRLEVAYLDQNKREYEITRHISLTMIDPLALVSLRENGECFVDLPEVLFDMDYPGHYLRRIKSVSLTIPCVVGPYTSINCTLTLLANSARRVTSTSGGYARNPDPEAHDPRFADNIGAIQSIAISSAQNDSGMFELNFRDERYLPFEGAGAISRWRIEMPKECNQFDFKTISDVVLHLKYTARDGGQALKNESMAEVVNAMPRAGIRLFSMRHEFSAEWYRFLHPAVAGAEQILDFTLGKERFPFFAHDTNVVVMKMEVLAKCTSAESYEVRLSITHFDGTTHRDETVVSPPIDMPPSDAYGGLKKTVDATAALNLAQLDIAKPMTLKLKRRSTPAGDYTQLIKEPPEVEELYLIVHYKLDDRA
jgi:receptor-binding and translocation channel-forming TcA subunit of Tc toxin/ABC toxin-like protein/neuraminidase-like protein/putative peptidoglycan binding protein